MSDTPPPAPRPTKPTLASIRGRRPSRRLRPRATSHEEVIQRVRAELGEFYDDYLIIVRRRSPETFCWAMSDPQWASGAMDRVLRKVIG